MSTGHHEMMQDLDSQNNAASPTLRNSCNLYSQTFHPRLIPSITLAARAFATLNQRADLQDKLSSPSASSWKLLGPARTGDAVVASYAYPAVPSVSATAVGIPVPRRRCLTLSSSSSSVRSPTTSPTGRGTARCEPKKSASSASRLEVSSQQLLAGHKTNDEKNNKKDDNSHSSVARKQRRLVWPASQYHAAARNATITMKMTIDCTFSTTSC